MMHASRHTQQCAMIRSDTTGYYEGLTTTNPCAKNEKVCYQHMERFLASAALNSSMKQSALHKRMMGELFTLLSFLECDKNASQNHLYPLILVKQ